MNDLNPINQVRLFGLDKFFNELKWSKEEIVLFLKLKD